jgi:hypothetical protein
MTPPKLGGDLLKCPRSLSSMVWISLLLSAFSSSLMKNRRERERERERGRERERQRERKGERERRERERERERKKTALV